MANKLFLVCTTLALCFLLTNASIYRTVVELDEEDETNPLPIGPFAPKQKCRREFQQAQHLRACQRFINKQAKQSRGPALDDDELDFEDDIENRPPWGQSPLLQQCCNELRQEEPVCVCPTLKQAAKAVRLQEQYQGPQARKIYKTAKYLPKVCKIPQVDVCSFFKIPFFPPYY